MLLLQNLLQNFCKKISPVTFFSLLIICLGGLFVRLNGISDYDFNDDELWHLVVANQDSLWQLLKFNMREEIHPPLSFIIWHFALKISHNDLWLRMPTIIAGIALIPSAYVFGRIYIGRVAAWAIAFVVAFGAMTIAMSTSIRGYSFMMLAIVWAAIFLQKFCEEKTLEARKKYLIYYFSAAFLAIQLNHAALFALAAFGLVMILQLLYEKRFRFVVLTAAIHLLLAAMVGGYAFVLEHFYGLQKVTSVFSSKDIFEYLGNYVSFYMWFLTGEGVKDEVDQVANLIGFFSFFGVPFILIAKRQWRLLIISIVPLALIIFTDYLRIYPFTGTNRNNLFAFLAVLTGYGSFAQNIYDSVSKKPSLRIAENYRKLILPITVLALFFSVFLAAKYVMRHDSFRKTMPNCVEFGAKKSDTALLNGKLKSKDSENNVFVTIVRNIWYWRLKYGDEGHLTLITENLGKFEADGKVFYFTAFPPREKSIVLSAKEYQDFFRDLLVYLQASGKLQKVKSFTFFDIGYNIDFLTKRFLPEFFEGKDPFVSTGNTLTYALQREGIEIGWAIHASKEMLDKFYFKDVTYQCGREVLVMSFTPQFVRQEFLNKKFLDGRKIYNEFRLNE